jgi:hypothetical protein
MNNPEKMQKALDNILDELDSMTDEELKQELDKFDVCKYCDVFCCPAPNCGGPCQGMGACFDCRRFQFDMFGINDGTYIPPKE